LSIAHAKVTEPPIRSWFSQVGYFLGPELMDVLKNPCRIFNSDETALWLNPDGDKVLARRGVMTYAINANDNKVQGIRSML